MADPDKSNPKFTLKNFNADQFSSALTEHQNSFIKIVLIIGSLVLVGVMFNDHRVKEEGLRVKISKVNEKLVAIKARDAADLNLNSFKSTIPKKINEFELINLISNYAKLYNVIITSLSPAESKNMGLYDVINVSFVASFDDFKEMVLFLRKIEKSSFPLRIDSWSGQEIGNGKINIVIEISAVLIHI